MKRKLVLMGKHTLMAAIPSKWIKRHNLKKGDHINFSPVDNKLVLTSTAEVFEKKTKIDLDSPKIEIVWRLIQPTYTLGYDEVVVEYSDPKTLKTIEGCVDLLIGFEIVESKPNKVVLKSVAQYMDDEFDTILQRVFLLLKQVAKINRDSFKLRQVENLNQIKTLELTINKYVMLLKRTINRTGYKYPHYMYSIVSFLELAANQFDYVRRYFQREKEVAITKIMTKEATRLYNLVEKTHKLYYKYSKESFATIALEQPHFFWFKDMENREIQHYFRTCSEYLVQIARQTTALNT